jgi:hypothetical protein
MTLQIEREALDALGGEANLNAAIAAYRAALKAFETSENQPSPIAHPVVVGIVTRYAGQYSIIEPEPEPEPPPPPAPTPSNTPLSMRQLRLGLVMNGFPVGFIVTAINAIPDTMQRAIATIWYEETSLVHWDHPMTQSLIAASGLTTEQAAAMWMAAKDLEA